VFPLRVGQEMVGDSDRTVYLDHAATTPMRPEAAEAYLRAASVVGNPSSIHAAGQRARETMEQAREQLAQALDCDPVEVVFTSGGTEAVNLAVKGLFWSAGPLRRAVVLPAGEHHATIDAVEWLVAQQGAEAVELPLDATGAPSAARLAHELDARPGEVALVSALLANNELGSLAPAEAIVAAAAARGVPVHLDAVAAFGHVPLSFRALRAAGRPAAEEGRARRGAPGAGAAGTPGEAGLAAVSVSGHKVGGPIGSGALVVARGADPTPLLHGGGQQRSLRSGTEDVAAAAAFAAAATAAVAQLQAEAVRLSELVRRLWAGIVRAVPDAVLNGPPLDRPRVPGILNVAFPGADGEGLLYLLDSAGVAVSTGSACQAGVARASHVLLALGREEAQARSALRLSLGWSSSEEDVDAFLAALPQAVVGARR